VCKTILILTIAFGGILVIKEQLLFEEKVYEKEKGEENKETPKELINKSQVINREAKEIWHQIKRE
jgi:hypothetical protein